MSRISRVMDVGEELLLAVRAVASYSCDDDDDDFQRDHEAMQRALRAYDAAEEVATPSAGEEPWSTSAWCEKCQAAKKLGTIRDGRQVCFTCGTPFLPASDGPGVEGDILAPDDEYLSFDLPGHAPTSATSGPETDDFICTMCVGSGRQGVGGVEPCQACDGTGKVAPEDVMDEATPDVGEDEATHTDPAWTAGYQLGWKARGIDSAYAGGEQDASGAESVQGHRVQTGEQSVRPTDASCTCSTYCAIHHDPRTRSIPSAGVDWRLISYSLAMEFVEARRHFGSLDANVARNGHPRSPALEMFNEAADHDPAKAPVSQPSDVSDLCRSGAHSRCDDLRCDCGCLVHRGGGEA